MEKLKEKLQSQANVLVQQLLKSKHMIPHRCEFRGSNLPFCQMDMALTTLADWYDFTPNRRATFLSDMYMDIGTAVHTTMQRWLARTGKLWGDWHCYNCQHVWFWSKNHICERCGKQGTYKELSLAVGDLTGHCDGFIQLLKYLLLLEIKTTSTKKMTADDLIYHPYPHYIAQTSSYRESVRRQYKKRTDGVMFLFVPRDDFHIITPAIFLDKDLPQNQLRKYHKQYNQVFKAIKANKVGKLKRLCASQADGIYRRCPWSMTCFSEIVSIDQFVREKCRKKPAAR